MLWSDIWRGWTNAGRWSKWAPGRSPCGPRKGGGERPPPGAAVVSGSLPPVGPGSVGHFCLRDGEKRPTGACRGSGGAPAGRASAQSRCAPHVGGPSARAYDLPVAVVDERALYGVPRDRFVAERNALARALRADGHRDDAQRVGKLGKPTVAVWTVNQLARREPDAIDELFTAGEQLADAQRQLIAGDGDRDALRAAGRRVRAAVDALVATARGVIGAAGDPASPATLDRVAETLHAAALEPEVHQTVRNGCLDRELRHVGLGDVVGPAQPGDQPVADRRASRDSAGPPAAGTKPRDRQRQVEHEQARRERERLEGLRIAEPAARRRSDRAAGDLRLAEEARDRAAAALDDADRALTVARDDARAAAEHHRSLQRDLEQSATGVPPSDPPGNTDDESQ